MFSNDLIVEEEPECDVMTETTELDFRDYVIISDCNCACFDAELWEISDNEALKVALQEEVCKNRRYFEKVRELSRKYQRAIKKIEYQKIVIDELSKQLRIERLNHRNSPFGDDFAVLEDSCPKIEEMEEP